MKVEWVRVGEVLELQRRSVAPELDEHYVEIGVRSFARGLFKKHPTSGTEIGSKRVFRIEPGDLVVSNVFAWEGAVAVADERHQDTIGSHRFMTWTPVGDRVSANFLAHYFASDKGIESLGKASPGSAGRNRTLSIKNFESIEVPAPTPADQRRIAAHLDRFSERLTGGHADAHADLLASALLDAFPWESTMGDMVVEDLDEVAIEPEHTYRLGGVFGKGRGMIDRGSMQGSATAYRSMYRLRVGQVVLSRLKAFEGAVAVVPKSLDGAVVSKEFPVFSVRQGVDAQFIAAVLRSPRTHQAMATRSTGIGARRERLSAQSFLQVEAPSLDAQARAQVGALTAKLEEVALLKRRAGSLAAALLPAARNEIFSAMR